MDFQHVKSAIVTTLTQPMMCAISKLVNASAIIVLAEENVMNAMSGFMTIRDANTALVIQSDLRKKFAII
jgi:hypothetical protein